MSVSLKILINGVEVKPAKKVKIRDIDEIKQIDISKMIQKLNKKKET